MTCAYDEWDGAYVLGSLPPAERLEFEQHLAECDACATSVRELAGMPGLLARVDQAILEEPPVEQPPLPNLLPTLLDEVGRERRRRLVVVSGIAAALVLMVAGLGVGGLLTPQHSPAGTPAPVAAAMSPVGDVPLRATLSLDQVAWGTRLNLVCTYHRGTTYPAAPRRALYLLVVRTRDGHIEQVGTWRTVEDRTMRLTAATATPRDDIASVEVRLPDGRPVLRLKS